MWKYRCKSHLLSLLASFLIGSIFGGVTYLAYGDSMYLQTQDLIMEMGLSVQEYSQALDIFNNPIVLIVSTGIVFAGLVNVVLWGNTLMSMYSVSPLIFIFLMMFASVYLLFAGIILLIPTVFVCLYGMFSLRSSISFLRKNRNITSDEEIVRVYKIHHELKEDVISVANECKKNVRKVVFAYGLGLVAALFVMFMISSMFVLMLLFVFFFFAFNYMLRYYANALVPMRMLLYQNCDPEACASAIFHYSTNSRGKVHLTNHILLAQALLYMDDPDLAYDVLISYPRKDQSSALQYYSLLATIQYRLKDEDGLARCKEEAAKVKLNYGLQGIMVRNKEIAAIQNKLDLMNGQFNTCKKYYLEALKSAVFPFQQVDASYYIAMISFVEQDYVVARVYFQKVIELGNKIYFVQKAQRYLSKIESMEADVANEM